MTGQYCKKMLAGWALSGALTFGLTGAMAADAVPDIKPGLWEMHMEGGMANQMQQAMQQMQEQLAAMPLEERQQMEAMMGNMGADMADKGVRICMTAEDIQNSRIPVTDGECVTQIKERTALRWLASASCTDPQMTVETEANFTSPSAYSVRMKGVMMHEGREQPIDMAMSMKHVSADCGEVKPRSASGAPQR